MVSLALAVLPPEKQPPVAIEQEDGWAQELVFDILEKVTFCPCQDSNP
jgi:hypothetical protein